MSYSAIVVSDIHIKADGLDILKSWEHNRLMLLADSINNIQADTIWILGDLFDKHYPSMLDIICAKDFINALNKPVQYLEGNHERINNEVYTISLLADTLGIAPLLQSFSIGKHSVFAISHKDLELIPKLPSANLLLSHFRWTHSVFGNGELSKTTENFIPKNFDLTILGDIHYPYEPVENVKYISSPYSISFSSMQEYNIGIIDFADELKFTRIPLDLPCKIKFKLPLSLVYSYIESANPMHKYRLIVDLRFNEYDKFKQLKRYDNIEYIPKLESTEGEVKEIEEIKISANVEKAFMDTLSISNEDKEYIKNIIKGI